MVAPAQAKPIEVKVFIAAMLKLGKIQGDKAANFKFCMTLILCTVRLFKVAGAQNPVYCNDNGVCGGCLVWEKFGSSSILQAILLNDKFWPWVTATFLNSGVGGTPPSRGTIGDVSWAHGSGFMIWSSLEARGRGSKGKTYFLCTSGLWRY